MIISVGLIPFTPPPPICPCAQEKLFKSAALSVTFILQRHFKRYRYARVILCDVAARGVSSFQVHYLWTSNLSLSARVWICFKKSNAPCVGERQPTLPGLSLPRQTGWNSSPTQKCRTRRPLCVPPLPLVVSKCYTKSCWLLKALQSQQNTQTDVLDSPVLIFITALCKYCGTLSLTPVPKNMTLFSVTLRCVRAQ